MKSKYFLPALLLCSVLFFASCASRPQFSVEDEESLYPAAAYLPESFDWQEVRDEDGGVVPGFWRFDFENPSFPIRYHAVKLDLEKSGLEVVCFPDATYAGEKLFRGVTTQSFAKKKNCLVAVNLSPFAGRSGRWDFAAHLSAVRQIKGVHIDRGFMISQPIPGYAALLINRSETGFKAEIVDSQSDGALTDCDFAFGGFYVVLRDGQVRRDFVRRFDSRSGAGLSADGRTLYLLVVEGERLSKSLGLSYPQCAEIFKAMGCDDALELDGGGSSDLCINGKSVMSYKVTRVQANCFGFCVK